MITPLIFHPTTPPDDVCGICLEADQPENSERWIGHDVGSTAHKYHQKCIVEWAKMKANCPYCQGPLDFESLFDWKDRWVIVLQDHGKIILDGVSSGMLVSIAKNFFDSFNIPILVFIHCGANSSKSIVRSFKFSKITGVTACLAAFTSAMAGTLALKAIEKVSFALSEKIASDYVANSSSQANFLGALGSTVSCFLTLRAVYKLNQ